jgi:L-asparaginase II
MNDLWVESTRGTLVESVHRVACAVVDQRGDLVAFAGDPDRSTFWRSAAKPFQALPLVEDGIADRFGFEERHLALACASHSSEPGHVELARDMLRRVGRTEGDLACGPHVPLSPLVAAQVARGEVAQGAVWSNCSGKHAAMLGAVTAHGWPVVGYEAAGHPLQHRILASVARWSGMDASSIGLGVDGCTTVCFALPLRAMARAYARLAATDEPAAVRMRDAMLAHPWLVAGTGRACTDIMNAAPGRVLAKIGAGGIYSAALIRSGLGIALKVEDGDMQVAPAALLRVLAEVAARWEPDLVDPLGAPALAVHAGAEILSTRGRPVGLVRARGQLRFPAPAGVAAVGIMAGE